MVSGLGIYVGEDLGLSHKLLYFENTDSVNQEINDYLLKFNPL